MTKHLPLGKTTTVYEGDKSIAIIDFGGQYCHLIARRLRQLGVQSRIYDDRTTAEDVVGAAGIILSGGPKSVYDRDAPKIDKEVFDLDVPVLGICYGHQLVADFLGAEIRRDSSEYGLSELAVIETENDPLFHETPKYQPVWMSHSDSVIDLPSGTRHLAETERCRVAAFANTKLDLYGVQFHPEVTHTKHGLQVLRNFARGICRISHIKKPEDMVSEIVHKIREQVGRSAVFFFVSGGVDSTVAFALSARALPSKQLLGMYVDTGLMRKGETDELRVLLRKLGVSDQFVIREEADRFLRELSGVIDPEVKRKIIGQLFIDIQDEVVRDFQVSGEGWMLGQGTIYPDTIESGGSNGAAAVIKTHHNRCEAVRKLLEQGRVVEPLVEFYKDEVREIGSAVGLESAITKRWPFPGPGLAIRCICTEKSEGVSRVPLADSLDGYEAVELPLRSVGVQGDERSYCLVAAVKGPLEPRRLRRLSRDLCNMGTDYNRVMVHVAGEIEKLADGVVKPAAMSKQRLEVLREADYIVRKTMEENNLTEAVWQFPVVLVPFGFSGGESVVLRPVNSEDGMTANFAWLPERVVRKMSDEIVRLAGIDAVFLDISDKPPATIEWE